MWDDPSERDGTGRAREGCVQRVPCDRDDEADPHVPRVELLDLVEVAEPSEKREERRHLPGLAVDARCGPRIFSRSTTPTRNPARSYESAAYIPGISAVSPPRSATPRVAHASAIAPTTRANTPGSIFEVAK